jgi:hypothetical protein
MVMPFRGGNAPATFERLMETVSRGFTNHVSVPGLRDRDWRHVPGITAERIENFPTTPRGRFKAQPGKVPILSEISTVRGS